MQLRVRGTGKEFWAEWLRRGGRKSATTGVIPFLFQFIGETTKMFRHFRQFHRKSRTFAKNVSSDALPPSEKSRRRVGSAAARRRSGSAT
jgi:hypothetical protein